MLPVYMMSGRERCLDYTCNEIKKNKKDIIHNESRDITRPRKDDWQTGLMTWPSPISSDRLWRAKLCLMDSTHPVVGVETRD